MSSLLQHFPSDEQLTAAVGVGDQAAFEELYRRYAGPLGAYGARVLRDRSRGEDVAQTALMRAYDALRRGTEPLRVKPWLYKIALNTALELKAKTGEVLDGESEDVEDTSLDMRGARADILLGLRDLPERQRKVFVLREIKGLPVGEVAGRLELTNQQVEQALFAARNRLAEVLVFGERVDCGMVGGLDRARLTHYERRALKSHLRACPSCRRKSGFGLSTLGFWLRDVWGWLVGGGASAAKLGAVAVTATVVGGAPIVAPAVVDRMVRNESKANSAGATPSRKLVSVERLASVVANPYLRRDASAASTSPPARDPFADLAVVSEEPVATEPAHDAGGEAQESAPPVRTEADTAVPPDPEPVEERPAVLAVEPTDAAPANERPSPDKTPADPPPTEEPAPEAPTASPAPDLRTAEPIAADPNAPTT